MQAPSPAALLYSPAPHAVHAPPSAPVQPALQVQFVILMLAIGESELAGQPWHSNSPIADTALLYFPVSQFEHGPPSGHTITGHQHADAPSSEYEIPMHWMHGSDPGNALNVPAGHGAHTSPKGMCPALHTQLADPPHPRWLQTHPSSTFEQVALHPSPPKVLPSSHVSLPASLPSPHFVVHTLGSPLVQVNPHSIVHAALHPSPASSSSSSHCSLPAVIPSPHSSKHWTPPVDVLYLPGAHAMHPDPE
jgi:hypothetical protein